MIESTVIQFLSTQLSVNVSGETPTPMPASFVVVEKTGGSAQNHVPSSTIAVQSYGDSMLSAAALNESIIDLMLYGLIEDPTIVSVRLNACYNYTDTQAKKYRYQAVFNITHY